MTYEQLRKIAEPHIRKSDNLPSSAFSLLKQLHIPYKEENQCRKDFEGKYNPLDNHPAFLYINQNGEKTLYFKTSTRYSNYYIFHEIAHYLLEHEDSSPQNEMDANLLACILAAPIENFPTYLKTAEDLSALCKIPIDRAEEYWQEIYKTDFKAKIIKSKNKSWLYWVIPIIVGLFILLVSKLLYPNIIYIDHDHIGHITKLCPQIDDTDNLEKKEYSEEIDDDFEHCSTCFLLKDMLKD